MKVSELCKLKSELPGKLIGYEGSHDYLCGGKVSWKLVGVDELKIEQVFDHLDEYMYKDSEDKFAGVANINYLLGIISGDIKKVFSVDFDLEGKLLDRKFDLKDTKIKDSYHLLSFLDTIDSTSKIKVDNNKQYLMMCDLEENKYINVVINYSSPIIHFRGITSTGEKMLKDSDKSNLIFGKGSQVNIGDGNTITIENNKGWSNWIKGKIKSLISCWVG